MKRIHFAAVLLLLLACHGRAAVLRVDINSTNPVPPFVDWSTAATNIQDAVDVATNGDLVLVMDGLYQTGSRTVDGTNPNRLAVTNALTIQSVGGPANTTIDGGIFARCVYLGDGAMLVGFTLTNGATYGEGGGALCASTNATLLNCTLVNNSAAVSGGGAAYGNLLNCSVLGNWVGVLSQGGGLSGCIASNCLIANNAAGSAGGGATGCVLKHCTLTNNNGSYVNSGYAGGAYLSTLEACTLAGNGAENGGGAADACSLNNCVIWRNSASSGCGGALDCMLTNCTLVGNHSYLYEGGADGCTLVNCILYANNNVFGQTNFNNCSMNFCCTLPMPADGVGNLTNAPLFADEADGDLHLRRDSPCINAGDNGSVSASTDLDGNPRVVQAAVDIGAYEYQSLAPVVLIQSDFTNTLPGVPLNFSAIVVRGNVSQMVWDFGDGTVVSNQPAVSHTWATAGGFAVILYATDSGAVGSTTSMVHVATTQIQPPQQSVFMGGTAGFSIISEVPQVAWQWLFNGTNLPGATNSSLFFLNAQTNQAGVYSALVTLDPPGGYPPGRFTVATPSSVLTVIPQLLTNTMLYVDVNSTNPALPYADWSTAATAIQDAVGAAAPGALIVVNDGVYQTGVQTADGVSSNRVTVTKALTIQSLNGPVRTTIDGDGTVRCVYLADGAVVVGFTLTNGFSPSNGGGAFGSTTNSVLSNCVITSCSAPNGGGLWGGSAINSIITSCGQSGSTTGGGGSGCRLTNCLLQNNAASSGGGASDSTLMGCEVINNGASSTGGGLQDCSASYCDIRGNTSGGAGGGAYGGLINNSTIAGNQANTPSCCSAAGGGVAYSTANDCVIRDNSADGYGGGAFSGTLNNCIIYNNGADWGGGTWVCVVQGSWLAQNFAALDGGADVRSGMLDCTIVQNYCDYGGVGGVDGGNLYNCIIYSNLSGNVPSNGANTSYSYCCTTPMPTAGAGNITNAPIFAADGIHITASSPCRRAGSLAYTRGVDIDGLPWLNPPSIGCAEYYTNAFPALALRADYTNVLVGNPLTLQGVVTDGQAAYLLWNYGDSSAAGSGLITSHVWTTPGDYTVQVTAFFSGTPITASQSVVIHVAANNTPVILAQPADQTVTEGGAAQFNVVANGSPVLGYQWQFDGADIPGATNSSLQLFYVQTNQAGLYSVIVFEPLYYPPGQTVSSNALLTVNRPVCSLPSQGLVAWWRAEGDCVDVVDGIVGLNQNVTFAPGKVGQAFVFADGASSIAVPPSSTLDIAGAGGLTIECWIRPDAFALAGPGAPIVEWDAGATNYLQFWAGRRLFANVVDGSGASYSIQSAAGVLDTNHWQHIAFTYDTGSGVAAIYLNGNVAASNNIGSVQLQTSCGVNIGWSASTSNFFGGMMDELSIYDRALSPAEIGAVFNAEYDGKCNVAVAPTVVLQPANLSVLPGGTAQFNVVAGGTAPLIYQWLLNGSPITAATHSSLILSNAACGQNGTVFSVSITNAGGSVVSSNAVLTIINTPPQISSISNQLVSYSTPVVTIPFQVSDPGLAASSVLVSGASSNTNLVPNGQIVFGGTDTNRTVTLTANSNVLGGATISVTATGPCGATNQTAFNLIVTNFPPQISALTNLHVPINVSTGPLPFIVSDLETPAARLTVTASSSNTNVVPPAQIVFGGAGTNRTVNITPATNQAGSATITLVVTDDVGGTSQTSFTVTVDQFTPLPTGLPALQYGAVAWGDYDNDGALDLLITGSTNGGPSGGITRLYHNDGGQFTNFISFPGLFGSAIAWGDYDRDGHLDFVVSGMTVSNTPITRIYHNNSDGTFTDINAGLVGVYFGSVAWGDYDNDGAPDLIVSGRVPLNAGQDTNVCRLYHNEGNGRFLDIHASLPAPTDGTTAWGDFDNDGRLDLLMVGNLPPGPQNMAAIYRNLGNGVFTNINAGLPTSGTYEYQLSAVWGDYDNDGLLDVAIANGGRLALIYHNSGTNAFTLAATLATPNFPTVIWGDYDNDGFLDLLVSDDYISHLYRNNGNGTFADTRLSLPNAGTEAIAWGDVYNSGVLDIFFDGNSSPSILRNNNGVSNTPPTAPSALAATVGLTNTVVFTWSPALDAQTRSNGLSYNLRVGTAPGGFDVVSPQADPVTGQRRLPALGDARPTDRAMLMNLPAGTYYWSVQAIDTTFAGSPFASEATFTITNARPVISPIADQTIAPATPTPILPFTIGDVETAASNLVLSVQCSDTNVVPLTSIILSGTDSNRTVRITPRTNGVSLITIHVTDEQGAFGTASFLLTATQFAPVAANLVPVQNSIIAWGDFNNDGRLDVLVAGNTNGNTAGMPVTLLYRNDGNGVFTPVPTVLPGLTYGSAAWGDFNNDGQLDLVVTGTTNGQPSGAITRVYLNNNGTLTDIGAALPALSYSSAAWGDFDNDGRLDLLLAGSTNGAASGAITQVYHNNGNGTFSLFASLTGIFQGSVACADLDGDGALDVVITGIGQTGAALTWVFRNSKDGTFTPITSLQASYGGYLAIGDFDGDGHPDIFVTGGYLTRLYRNLGNFTFTNLGVNIPAVAGASAAWGDFNNDGRLDLVLCGTVNGGGSGAFTRLYLNTGSLVGSLAFSNFPVNLPTNYFGPVTWADFNQDNKLDILLAGTDGVLQGSYRRSQTALFMNTSGISNTPPTAPGALSYVRSNNTILLTWAPATDAQTTNASGLSYDLRVGRTSGGIEVVSPPTDIGSGLRRLVQMGAASTTQWQLMNLLPGTYYWSVQAIDTSFAGSLFGPEATFVVLAPPIAVPDAIGTTINTPITFPEFKLTTNDIETNGYPLTVIAVSAASARGGAVLLSSNNVTYAPPPNFSGNDSFTYTVSDGQSAPATSTVFATVGSGGPISLKITFGPTIDNGDFVVRYGGVPGATYTIEATSDLNGPWSKVVNISSPPGDLGFGPGVFEFRVPIDGHQIRFYRVIFPAY
jgi:hypothetical protein